MRPVGTKVVFIGFDRLSVQRTEAPTPGPRGVLIRTQAAGVAFAEVQMLRGRYPTQPRFPFTPGYDLVGEVVEVGSQVTSWQVGQRVAAMPRTGSWAEYVEIPSTELIEVPAAVDAAEAVALVLGGVTARQLLRASGVRSGQTVLVHGIGGGVGMLLAQLAVSQGIRVIGTASAWRHEKLAGLGATLIDRGEDVGARIAELAPEGVDAVFEPVGPKSLPTSWRMLATGGVLLSYGSFATVHDTGPSWRPYLRIARLLAGWELARMFGRTQGRKARMYYIRIDEQFRTDLAELLDIVAAGELTPVIAERIPLAQAENALAEYGKSTGRIVLVPGVDPAQGPKC